jgi:hypothetical protein
MLEMEARDLRPGADVMAGPTAREFGVTLAIVLASCAPSAEDLPSTDPAGAGITIEVSSCEFDPLTTAVRMTFELTSTESRGSVLLRGKVLDASGAVLGEAPAAIQGVVPGRASTGEVTVPLGVDPGGQVSCQVDLDLANP